MLEKVSDCAFCNLENKLKIHATKNFFVLFDPYPLIEGHLMVCSQKHYGCAGELPKKLLYELNNLKQTVSFIIKKIYKNVCVYEHGRAGGCMPTDPDNRMCHHCHLHILPFNGNILRDLGSRFGEERMSDFLKIKKYYEGYGEYLYFEASSGEKVFYSVNEKEVPIHYFRTIISEHLGKPHLADWTSFLERNDSLLSCTLDKIQRHYYLFN